MVGGVAHDEPPPHDEHVRRLLVAPSVRRGLRESRLPDHLGGILMRRRQRRALVDEHALVPGVGDDERSTRHSDRGRRAQRARPWHAPAVRFSCVGAGLADRAASHSARDSARAIERQHAMVARVRDVDEPGSGVRGDPARRIEARRAEAGSVFRRQGLPEDCARGRARRRRRGSKNQDAVVARVRDEERPRGSVEQEVRSALHVARLAQRVGPNNAAAIGSTAGEVGLTEHARRQRGRRRGRRAKDKDAMVSPVGDAQRAPGGIDPGGGSIGTRRRGSRAPGSGCPGCRTAAPRRSLQRGRSRGRGRRSKHRQ
jgi:hypothetical protein